MSKEYTVKQLKSLIEDTKFYLGMAQHALKGYFPHPGHIEEEARLSAQLEKLLKELSELEGKDE